MATLFRKLTNEKLAGVTLAGEVLDLGGSRDAKYHKLIHGGHHITSLNFGDENADIIFDLERSPLPITDNKFDAVLAVNLFEHIYHTKELLREVQRVLKPRGEFIITIPFLHQVHPSPHDYHRYTGECWGAMLQEAGLSDITVEEIGTGAWSAVQNQLERFFPSFINALTGHLAMALDRLTIWLCRLVGKKYDGTEYPLGYFIKARK